MIARKLRKNMTFSEVLLWNEIKKKKLKHTFNRQKIIGNYIVDFCCKELKLIIEVDGSSHTEKKYDYDIKREEFLRELGYKVVRYSDLEIKKDIEGVVEGLKNIILQLEKE